MAIDPNKLSALVEEQAANPLGDLPMPDEDEAGDEEEGGGDMAARGEELLTSMGEFGDELRESADIICDNAAECGEDVGSDEPSPETEEMAVEVAERLPTFIQDGMVENLAGKPREDLNAIGAALESSMDTEESPEGAYSEEMATQIGGMLNVVANYLAEGGEESEEEEEPEEEADAESEDEMPEGME